MAQHRVVLLPGDGIGPEITAVARQLLEVVSQRHGFSLSFEEQPIGGSAIDATGEPLPASTCLLYTSPSPRDLSTSRMPSSA